MSYAGRCPRCEAAYYERPVSCPECGEVLDTTPIMEATPFSFTSPQGVVVSALSEEIWRQRQKEGVTAALDLDLRKLADAVLKANGPKQPRDDQDDAMKRSE